MPKTLIRTYRPVFPSPAALITSVDKDGKPNIITLGEVFNISISKPVIIGIAIRPATYSHGLISAIGEFAVNLPSCAIARQVDACGKVSGRDGIDKFAAFGLTPLPASLIKPPLVAECPVNIECRVLNRITVGDHDLFLGEVLAVHADSEALDAAGRLDYDKVDVLVYMSEEYRPAGPKIGNNGFSRA